MSIIKGRSRFESNRNSFLWTHYLRAGLRMRSHEIARDDFDLIEKALLIVHRDQEKATWSPLRLPTKFSVVWAVTQAQGTIDNGGLQYFFENDWPGNPSYSFFSNALKVIGALEAANTIDAAVAMFPSNQPETDLELRRNVMEIAEQNGRKQSPFYQLSSKLIELGGETMMSLAAYIPLCSLCIS